MPFDKQSLIRAIDSAEIVSFDIFDTLVFRPYLKPTDVFAIVERSTKRTGFQEARIIAEGEARQGLRLADGREEVTLDEIYSFLPSRFRDLLQHEIDQEIRSCFANPQVLDVYQYAINEHKHVIITSDMYLPQQVIENILTACGFSGYHRLFLSSVLGKQKAGTLFNEIKRHFANVSPHRILHIGDNYRSDILPAIESGISTHYYPPLLRQALETSFISRACVERIQTDNCPDMSFLMSISLLHTLHSPDGHNLVRRVGSEIVWPVATAFCQWLIGQAKRQRLKRLYFLSRDGFLFHRICERITKPDESIELQKCYGSRRAITVPVEVTHAANIDPLLYGLDYQYTPQQLWHYLSIDDTDLAVAYEQYVADNGKIGATVDVSFLKQFLHTNFTLLKNALKREEQALCAYMQSVGLDAGRYGLVDIGWNGSMQRSLDLLTRQRGLRGQIHGFYLGTRETCALSDAQHDSFIIDKGLPRDACNLVAQIVDLIELFFTVPARSVKKFGGTDGGPSVDYFSPCDDEVTRLDISMSVNQGVDDVFQFAEASDLFRAHKFGETFSQHSPLHVLSALTQLPPDLINTLGNVKAFYGHGAETAKPISFAR